LTTKTAGKKSDVKKVTNKKSRVEKVTNKKSRVDQIKHEVEEAIKLFDYLYTQYSYF
jgi:hypothetical protein